MRPGGLPSEFMEDIKLRSRRRRKEQNRRLNTTFLFLGLLIVGIIICFILIGTPFFLYLIPLDPDNTADSSATPSLSMNSYLESAGMDASADLKLTDNTLQRDNFNSWVVGDIKNGGNKSYKGVTVYFDLYDSGGNPTGSTYAMMGDLIPGHSKKFSTNPSKGVAASAKMKYIIGE